jgi:predicted aconitase with swiveling domain
MNVLFPGTAEGELLVLAAPLSFWGGVSWESGAITNVRHPQLGEVVSGRVLVVPEPVGSSSSAAVLLELIRAGRAPAAIILGRPDAILVAACLVAREMGWPAPPMLVAAGCGAWHSGRVRIADGRIIATTLTPAPAAGSAG